MTTPESPETSSRARRLKVQTEAVHEQLDTSIMARGCFDHRQGYVGFVRMQLGFHREIAPLYGDAALQALIPDLHTRSRLALVEADARDLDLKMPPVRVCAFPPGTPIDTATALGWLYVAEGSNMGAALLRKAAVKLGLSDTFGARHLAPPPEGPAAHWRTFVTALDAAPLDPAQDDRAAAGARAAFAHVRMLADASFA